MNNLHISNDIDRSLAIFYHPLFQELVGSWCSIFQGQKLSNLQVSFIEFIEFNIRIQKCLLPSYDFSNAFISALNDWVKEITECFNHKDLYQNNDNNQDNAVNIKEQIKNCVEKLNNQNNTQTNPNQLRTGTPQTPQAQPLDEYFNAIEKFQNHEAFKLINFTITAEVFCKFLFDLSSTWCEFLDIELFIFFCFSIFLSITKGNTLRTSKMKSIDEITNLPYDFFTEFEQQKDYYLKNKKKSLRYYRAWCEWNYLRISEIGENLIMKLCDIYCPEEETRVMELITIFEKAIDTINSEINSQIFNQQSSHTPSSQYRKSGISPYQTQNIKYQQQLQKYQLDQDDNDRQSRAQKRTEFINKQLLNMAQKGTQQLDQYEAFYDNEKNQIIIKKVLKLGIKGKSFGLETQEDFDKKKQIQYQIQQQQLNINNPQFQQNSFSSSPHRLDSFNQVLKNKKNSQQLQQQQQHIRTPQNLQQNDQQIYDSQQQFQYQLQYQQQSDFSVNTDKNDSQKNILQQQPQQQTKNNILNLQKKYQQQPYKLFTQDYDYQLKTSQKLGQQQLGEKIVDKKQEFQKKQNDQLQQQQQQKEEEEIQIQTQIDKSLQEHQKFIDNSQIIPADINSKKDKNQLKSNLDNSIENTIINVVDENSIHKMSLKDFLFTIQNQSSKINLENRNDISQADLSSNEQQQQRHRRINSTHIQQSYNNIKKNVNKSSVLVPAFYETQTTLQFNQQPNQYNDRYNNQIQIQQEKAQLKLQSQTNSSYHIQDRNISTRDTNFQGKLWEEFSNTAYRQKRLTSADIPKRLLRSSNFPRNELHQMALQNEQLRSQEFDYDLGKIQKPCDLNLILQPKIHNKISINEKQNQNLQKEKEIKISNYNQQLYLQNEIYEMQIDKNLDLLQAQKIMSKTSNFKDVPEYLKNKTLEQQPQQQKILTEPKNNKSYKNAISSTRYLWKQYLTEDELLVLNDWDSLYKIILILKRKFNEEKKDNYLSYLNIDINPIENRIEEVGGIITIQDKERFHKRIQNLLKRQERRKFRRKLRAKQGKKIQEGELYKAPRPKSGDCVRKFKSKQSRQLFKDVFLPKLKK